MKYRYISGDSHLQTDSKVWVNRVPAEHRDRAPRLVRVPDGGDAWFIEGTPLRKDAGDLYGGKGRDEWQPWGQRYEGTAGTGPSEQRLREQDIDGIDAEVLFPAQGGGPRLWRAIVDDEAYLSVVRAYNDWLAEDYCSLNPDRLIGVGVIPRTNVKDAIAEMERCAQLGLKTVVLNALPSAKSYPTPEDDEFWGAAIRMGMPITVHPITPKELGSNTGLFGQVANEKFCRLGAANAVQLILAGVFDRFPTLRIDFAENQIGWVPFFLEMADVRYDRHKDWAERLLGQKQLKQKPSEYVREHCYWGFMHDRVGVSIRHEIGVNRLIWATDFPHQESDWPHSLETAEDAFVGVPDDERYKIMCGNSIEFFKLSEN
ncbi:MAG: Amidohydrolase [Chloroflexi bacterium]|nr:Amidohydrolase [Chloroflexota bacterium]